MQSAQSGVGLVEILVAVVIMAIGMLGLVGLQLSNLRNNQSALERGMAVVQTHSIADAMRAERATAGAGNFNIGLNDAAPARDTYAHRAVADWRDSLQDALGDTAAGSVACNNAAGVILCTITVRWNDARGSSAADEDASNRTITTDVQL